MTDKDLSNSTVSNTAPKPVPVKIAPLSAREGFLEWSNGIRFSVPYRKIRYLCGCAGCVDEHSGERIISEDSIPADIKVTGAEPVGRYAIKFIFSDGHSSGLYDFDRLYGVCNHFGLPLERNIE